MIRRDLLLRVTSAVIGCGLLLAGLVGCSSNSTSSLGQPAPEATAYGSLRFEVQWPNRAIPTGTDAIVIRVLGERIFQVYETNDARGMVVSIPYGTSTSVIDRVPVGAKLIFAGAWDNDEGKYLAYGQTTATVDPGQVANASVTMTAMTANGPDDKIVQAVDVMMPEVEPTSFQGVKDIATQVNTLATAAITTGAGTRAEVQGRILRALAVLTSGAADCAIAWQVPYDTGDDPAPPPPVAAKAAWMLPNMAEPVAAMGKIIVEPEGMVDADLYRGALLTPVQQSANLVQTATRQTGDTEWEMPALSTLQAGLETHLLPALVNARADLAAINLTTPIILPTEQDENGLFIDQGDVQYLLASIDLITGMVRTWLAYDVTIPDGFEFGDPAQFDANHDGSITPAEYLPPAPFGMLRTGGAQHLAQALTCFQNALDNSKAGITHHLSRYGRMQEAGELINSDCSIEAYQETASNLSLVRDIAAEFRTALSGPYCLSPYLTGLDADMTINLSAPFTTPITNIRSIMPTFTLIDPNLATIQPGGYPVDATTGLVTFGGLIPSGVPTDWLYPQGDVTVWIY
jgi:hypothetical protein